MKKTVKLAHRVQRTARASAARTSWWWTRGVSHHADVIRSRRGDHGKPCKSAENNSCQPVVMAMSPKKSVIPERTMGSGCSKSSFDGLGFLLWATCRRFAGG